MEKPIDENDQVQSLAGQSAEDEASTSPDLEEYLSERAAIDLDALSRSTEIPPAAHSSEIEPDSENFHQGSLQLAVIDNIGHAIPGLKMKLMLKNSVIFMGEADKDGIIFVENLPIGETLEIHVKTDDGDYKQIALAMIGARENVASLRSPKTKIELTSIYHQGEPGKAGLEKEEVVQKHNQIPKVEPEITGEQQRKPSVKEERNEKGHPIARVSYGLPDWFGLNRINPIQWSEIKRALQNSSPGSAKKEGGSTILGAPSALDHLNRLVAFSEKQAGWKYPEKDTSETIVAKMRRQVLETPSTKSLQKSTGYCNKYVKIALAYAEYGISGEIVGKGISPARLMGNELTKAGFANVSDRLGKFEAMVGENKVEQIDLTYALPGDVIVYLDLSNPTASGHIDIRTYHGFISDFIWPGRNGFPDLKKYKTLGVYRQYSDEVSLARVKAFLKILREHEAKGFKDPYRALRYDPSKGRNSHVTFDDLSHHPSDKRSNSPAGAYQIKYNTFNAVVDVTGWPSTFTEKDQDRIAIYLLQGRRVKDRSPSRTALGYILEGKVEQAVKETKLWLEWSCLPSEGKESQMSMDELKKKFVDYTEEFCK